MSDKTALDRYLLDACSPRDEQALRVPSEAWPELLGRARQHKVQNLILDRLVRIASGPEARFVDERRQAAARGLFFTAGLLEAMAALDAAGIEALSFKGLLLSETVFGGPDIRTFGDIDILVPKRELEPAARLLMDRGYRLPGGVALADYLGVTLRGGHHLVMQHEKRSLVVELHWEMSGRYLPVELDFAAVSPFLERVSLQGRELWNLGPEIAPLYLSVHGAKEYWRILDHVVCVAWQLERRPPDWAAMFELAERWGAVNILLVGLGLSRKMFGVDLPGWVQDRLRANHPVTRLIDRQSRRIFDADRLVKLGRSSLAEFIRMHWIQLDNPAHFFRWVRMRLTTPSVDEMDAGGAAAPAAVGRVRNNPLRSMARYLRGP